MLFPQTRRELCDPGCGVLRDALEHIDEVGDDQALDYADVAGTELGPTEKP